MAQENYVFHIAQTVKLHMYKDETPVRIPLQQYDDSAQKINFDILMGDDFDDDTAEEVTLPTVGGGATVQRDRFFAKIEGTKSDNTGFSYDCDPCSFYKDSNGRYKITTAATVTEQMTTADGAVRVWIKIENKGSKVDDTPTAVKHSEVFVFAVERAAYDEGKIDLSKTEIPSVEAKLQGYVETARGYAGDAGYQAALAKQYAEGMPGVSPEVEVEAISGGHTVTITDLNGEKTFSVMDGSKGDKGDTGATGAAGADGADGVSPTVTTETITGGTKVTITDLNGEHSFSVMDGAKGAQGAQGEKGDTGAQGEKGEKGDKGDPGLSPTITTTPTETGHTLTITDIDGKKTLTLLNGEKGEKGDTGATGQQGEKGDKGDTGEAGVSPTVTTEAITNGHKVTITDATGAHEFTLTNGAQGEPGYTPVKGTDYFTEQDITEFVNMVAIQFDGTNVGF